jgi:DNA-binding MarR family transcriptional regulator
MMPDPDFAGMIDTIRYMKSAGFHYSEWMVLFALAANNGMSIRELSDYTGLSQSSVTLACKFLISHGLIDSERVLSGRYGGRTRIFFAAADWQSIIKRICF